MGETIIGLVLRLLAAGTGFAVGAVCAFAAFQNGHNMADGDIAWWFGIGFAGVVAASWLCLPIASWCGRLGSKTWSVGLKLAWLPLFAFVVANAIVFCATHRTETVGGKSVMIDGYEDARADKSRAIEELKTLKTNARWTASQGCSNATAQQTKVFCDSVRGVEGRIQAATATIAKGRPAAIDPGADILAWVLQGDPAKVGKGFVIFAAVILELVASLFTKLALSPWAPKSAVKLPVAEAQKTVTAEASAKAVPDTLSQVKAAVLASPGFRLAVSGRALAEQLGLRRQTFFDRLESWQASGDLVVERKRTHIVLSLPNRKAA